LPSGIATSAFVYDDALAAITLDTLIDCARPAPRFYVTELD